MMGVHVGEFCYKAYAKRQGICGRCPIALTFKDGRIHTVRRELQTGKEIRYAEITASPLKDSKGNIIAGIEVVRDITDRKQAEKKINEQLEFLQTLLDTIPNPVFYKNIEGKYLGCNEAFELFTGRKKEELIGKTVYDMGPKEIADKYFEKDNELFQNPGLQTYEWKVRDKDGILRDVVFNKAIFNDAKGGVAGLIGVISDITERKQAEESVERLYHQNELVLNAAGEGIFGLNVHGNHIFVNPAAAQMLGYTVDELIGRHSHTTWHHSKADGSPYHEDECPIYATLKDGKAHHMAEEVFWRKDGTSFPASYTSTPIKEGNNIVGAVVIFLDITVRKSIEEELNKLATTDTLTGALNRTKFQQTIEKEIERFKRYNQTLSIMLFDIDDFKEVNDRHGHVVGDYLLKTIAGIVRENIRKIDYFVRWGGEEFLVLSSGTQINKAHALAERIRNVIENYKFENVGKVTVSFGVTEFKERDTEDSFIKRADDAMYEAKKKGKNRVEVNV